MPLQYIFERISIARRDRATYLTFRTRREAYITDTMVNLNETQRHRSLQKRRRRRRR